MPHAFHPNLFHDLMLKKWLVNQYQGPHLIDPDLNPNMGLVVARVQVLGILINQKQFSNQVWAYEAINYLLKN